MDYACGTSLIGICLEDFILSTSIITVLLIPSTIILFYYQCRIYLSAFSFIICSYLLLSEFMRPLRPVQSLLTITRLMRKLVNELNLENTGILMDFTNYLAIIYNTLIDVYSA